MQNTFAMSWNELVMPFLGRHLPKIATAFKRIGSWWIRICKFIPSQLFIYGGLAMTQLRFLPMTLIDTKEEFGMWILWTWDFFAGYYIVSGVIFYFFRYFIRRYEKTHKPQ